MSAALPLDGPDGRIEACEDVEIRDPGVVEVLGDHPVFGTLLRYRIDPCVYPDEPDGLVFFVQDIDDWPGPGAAHDRASAREDMARAALRIVERAGGA